MVENEYAHDDDSHDNKNFKEEPAMRYDARKLTYDEVTLLGVPAIFTECRVDRTTVPPQLHLYEIRHEDEDWGRPCQLAKGILVNFYGSLLTRTPLAIPDSGYLDFDAEDLRYLDTVDSSDLESFLKGACPHAQHHL